MITKGSTKKEKTNEEDEKKEALRNAALGLEGTSKGTVQGSVFFKYLLFSANLFVMLIIIMLFVVAQGFASGADYWVSYWTSQEEQRTYIENLEEITEEHQTTLDGLLTTNQCIYIHAGLVAGIFVIGITRLVQ